MGMKKSAYLSSILMMGAMMGGMGNAALYGSDITQPNPKPKEPFKPTPFHKQEGISKMIKEYNLIKKGLSKKGIAKQNRIISKIKIYLEKGNLTEEHLKL